MPTKNSRLQKISVLRVIVCIPFLLINSNIELINGTWTDQRYLVDIFSQEWAPMVLALKM